MSRLATPPEERLLANRRIDPVTGCWLWTGYTMNNGYGQIGIYKKVYYVHRVAASIWLGLDLDNSKEYACHKDDLCKNHNCFNPDHLYVGNHSSNMQDAVESKTQNMSRKTQCKNGHPFDDINTYIAHSGRRDCKICIKARNLKHKGIKITVECAT